MITLSVDVGCRRGRCRAGRLNRRGKVTTVQPEVRVHAPSGLNSNSCLALAELGPMPDARFSVGRLIDEKNVGILTRACAREK
ncbi:hypothetical protein PQQ59_30460 [Paraburkholderia aspalathi]|uniref:hypothetical protein n=1 Tax=Paraburkholderia aspalathi TaxID=1324617 RepID=UPI0038B7FE0D